MADKPKPTLADYVTIVMSPALIIAMVVSVVFFLLAIVYYGEYAARLHYILFFFIFGMVLVARISMEGGIAERAPMYGIVLAVAVWFGMGQFVEGSSWLVNAGLIAVAWWLSYQITYSCTYIDEAAENTGTGVLQAAGLDQGPAATPRPSLDEKELAKLDWWDRWQRFREQRKKTQPPGLWVVYFGLAALPTFGLGQALVDPGDLERRSYTFWLMSLYVASSLGLLVTTAFLGLRRYLRQRRLEMPKLVTTAWLSLGAGLLLAFLVIGAVLPRPQAEISVLSLGKFGSKERETSKFGQGEPGKREERGSRPKHDPEGQETKGGKGDDDGKSGEKKTQGNSAKSDAGEKAGDGRDDKVMQKDAGGDAKKEAGDDDGKRGQQSAPPEQTGGFTQWLTKVANVVKWIVFALIALATLFFVLRGGLRYLANFTAWARRLLEALRNFWDRLFGGLAVKSQATEQQADVAPERRVPFAAFANPFENGRAQRMTAAELVRYSFEALQAWADERDFGRRPDETPLEFAERVASVEPRLAKEATQLGRLFAGVLYSTEALPTDWRVRVEHVWTRLEEAAASVSVHSGSSM